MNHALKITLLIAGSLLAARAHADTVTLKDGTSREGKILGQSTTEVRMRINQDGMQATISIPIANVSKIDLGPVKPTAASAPTIPSRPSGVTTQPTTGHTAAANGKNPPAKLPPLPPGVSPLPPTRGFFAELGSSLLGVGPDDPRRLPADLQALWKNAQQLDTANKRAAELDAMRTLEQAFAASPNGISRLDGISRHDRQESFGLWMAGVHWDILADTYHSGFFDLNDVRDVERPPLIGLFKEKTGPAIEPLKTYFPPIDDKTGKPAAFRPAQLQGITVDTALDIRDKALLAHALILGQIKLEPDMPSIDKQLLFTQLANINHILSRTSELEPQARALQQKADRAKKLGH